jgi:hypothetical protein
MFCNWCVKMLAIRILFTNIILLVLLTDDDSNEAQCSVVYCSVVSYNEMCTSLTVYSEQDIACIFHRPQLVLSNVTGSLGSNFERHRQYIYIKYLYLLFKYSSIDGDIFLSNFTLCIPRGLSN